MEQLYEFIGETRQNYHQKLKRLSRQELIEQELLSLVLSYRVMHPRMGSRQLYYTMKNQGQYMNYGVTKFEQFMSRKGLTVATKRSKKPRTSDGKGKGDYENLTNGLILDNINQLIVADITYYDIAECRCYIFALKDVYSQRFLGLIPSDNMMSLNALKCLEQMQKQRKQDKFPGCIHHSDNGSQYESDMYKDMLSEMGIKISRAENCVQNGSIEQMNHIVKNMYLDPWRIRTRKELAIACRKMIDVNNNERAIKQLGNLCPVDFKKKINEMSACQRPTKQLYDFNLWM